MQETSFENYIACAECGKRFWVEGGPTACARVAHNESKSGGMNQVEHVVYEAGGNLSVYRQLPPEDPIRQSMRVLDDISTSPGQPWSKPFYWDFFARSVR